MRNSNFVAGIYLIFLMGISGQVGAAEVLYRDTPYSVFVAGGMKWFTEGDEDTQVKYVGEVKDGVPHGQGVETSKRNIYRFEGKFVNGLKHGQGSMTYLEGSKHVGEYKDGKANGQGTLIASDGRRYVGNWKDGLPNGEGTVTYPVENDFPDGRAIIGEWREGDPWDATEYDSNLPKGGTVIAVYSDGIRTEK